VTAPSWVPPPLTQLFDMAIGEYGQDYAVSVNRPIYSPVAGIFATEDKGKKDWGNRAFVHASNGLSFAVGHLTAFAAVAGQKIAVGQLIGYSGGALNDPSSGVSTGPHVEVQFFTAAGKYINPAGIFSKTPGLLKTIFTGAGSNGAAPVVTTSATSTATDPCAGLTGFAAAWCQLTQFPANVLQTANPLSSIPSALGAIAGEAENRLLRAFWLTAGLGVVAFGILLIFFGDIERGIDRAADVAAKAGGAAADVAAPEVAIPAQAAARTAGAVA
jgi:hypothetical protein